MRRLRLAATSVLGAILLTAGGAQAQVLADRVPADAIIYAGWAGTGTMGTAYDASHLKAFLDAVKLPQMIDGHIQQLSQQITPQQKDDAQTVQGLLAVLAKSPTAIFMEPFDFPENAAPVPRMALIADLGTASVNIPTLSALIGRDRGPTAPRAGIYEDGHYLVIFLGAPDIHERIEAATPPKDNLASSPLFLQAMKQVGGKAATPAVVYVDAAAAIKTLGTAVDKSENTQAQRILGPLVNGFGLGGLTQAAFAGDFDGPDWRGNLFIGRDQKRGGFLFLFDSPAIPEADLRLIPKSATTAGSFRFDGMKFLQVLTDAANAATANGGQRIDQGLNQLWTLTGVDLKSDLFPGLGDDFLFYGSPAAAGNSIRGLTFINRLRDAKKGQSAMNEIESFINAALQQRNPNSPQFITQTLHDPFSDVTAHVINMPQVSPAYAIHDGLLYFSLSVPALEDALSMSMGKKESILDNPLFIAEGKKLGDRPFSSFMFEDLRGSAPETYQLLSRALAQARALTANRVITLPPLDQITPTLGPAMSVAWSDIDGYHVNSISPFPGSGYLNPFELIGLTLGQQQNAAGPAPARGRFPAPGDAMP